MSAYTDHAWRQHERDDDERDEPDEEPTTSVCRGCWSPIPMSLGEWCNSCRNMMKRNGVWA